MGEEREYVLGTHDDEVERLALQHRVWRGRVCDAWDRAGFNAGQTILDLGCGPGHASVDLAELVGPTGRVVAVDQSRRFLDTLDARIRARGLTQITPLELDLDSATLPPLAADGAWVRWVFAFVRDPRALLAQVHASLRPGGALVVYEYFDYETWQFAPRNPDFEEFVTAVMTSWRANGGEPNIGLELPRWLEELGFEIRCLRPWIDAVRPSDMRWLWPKAFVDVGLRRLVELGFLTSDRAAVIWKSFLARETSPTALQFTPSVLELIAVRK